MKATSRKKRESEGETTEPSYTENNWGGTHATRGVAGKKKKKGHARHLSEVEEKKGPKNSF